MGRAKKEKVVVTKAPLIRFLTLMSDYRQSFPEMPHSHDIAIEQMEMLARAALTEIARRDAIIKDLAERIHTLEFSMGLTEEEEAKIDF